MAAETPTVSYNADNLDILEGLDAVRKRPGMYIGSTDSQGVNHLLNEILDNATDEAASGHADRVDVVLHSDGSVEVRDNGRGIPTDVNTKTGMSGVELVLTRLHAGGKFGGSGYKTSGGLHGVGASAVNALSRRMDVKVLQRGKVHEVSFQHGRSGEFAGDGPGAAFTPKVGLRVSKPPRGMGKATGTSIRYWFDPTYFEDGSALVVDEVRTKIRNTAFLVPGITYTLTDRTVDPDAQTEVFSFPDGLVQMVDFISTDTAVCAPLSFSGEGTYKENVPDENGVMHKDVPRTAQVHVAMRWGTGYDSNIECFTNTIRNAQGGTHRKGFERALAKMLVEAIQGTRGLLRAKEAPPTVDDVLEGLTAVIHVNAPEPRFKSQTKDELSTVGVLRVTNAVVSKAVKDWLSSRKNRQDVRTVLAKIVQAARVRTTQKQQKESARRKTALEGAAMPAKLADCRTTGVARSELFIVEGDSAMGTAKAARNSQYQALLPIRGKILNVQKATLEDVFKNNEVEAIITAIGAGSGRTFELDAMRYGRIVLMTDADVDGAHIRTLLITLFAKLMRPAIEAGRVYAAMPPLHKVTAKGRDPQVTYTYTQEQMEETIARIEAGGGQVVRPVPRYKGLGEMDAHELWETTMDPAVRTVRRITMDDVAAAEAMLDLCMGTNVESRRDYIVENADKVALIDA